MDQKRILYIEDNPDNRLLTKRILMAEGYDVLEASDGLAGLAIAEKEDVDLILVDINMPGMDGYEVSKRLRAMPKIAKVPIIAMTANVLQGDREKSLEACDGYIPKPLDVDMLPQQVATFLVQGPRKH
ncbi:MAG: response regulator [Anaerolineae bacterium]|nr:response regulator [Anaerolineae bacterium]